MKRQPFNAKLRTGTFEGRMGYPIGPEKLMWVHYEDKEWHITHAATGHGIFGGFESLELAKSFAVNLLTIHCYDWSSDDARHYDIGVPDLVQKVGKGEMTADEMAVQMMQKKMEGANEKETKVPLEIQVP